MNKTSAALVRTLLLGTSCLSVLAVAKADPTGGTVVAGQGSITQKGVNTTIDQKTGKLVINWDSFSIDAGSTVRFNQPGSGSIALNRVTGSQASTIYGNLVANGQVWIINGNGMVFGKNAQVNVGGLIATTADIRDGDFLAGNYSFSGGTGAGIVNQGTIRARNGGSVVLSAASVSNQGFIAADTGTVVLGGSSAYTVDFDGDGLLRYAIATPTGAADNGKTGVSNSGTIKAAGGRVVMTARAAASVQDAVVNNTGMISASSARVQNGEVILDGGDGNVAVSGTIDASGTVSGSTGGNVTITGANVSVADNTKINVSGDSGGGTVRIGGDLHGGGSLQQSDNVHVGNATITADATRRGDGGKLIVWSTGQTEFAGIFSAKGGAQSGNGGFIETSGHHLAVAPTAKIDTSAKHGKTGNWLLDPDSIVIDNSGTTAIPDGGTVATGDDSGSTDFIAPSTIIAALANTNVTLEASTAIEVNDPVIYTSDHALTLLSQGNIGISAAVQNGGAGNITLIAGWDGESTDFSNLVVNGSDWRFGNNAGNVSIGNGHAAVGSLGGTTTVAGYSVLLQAQSNDAVAQIGYRIGVGAGGTGDIVVVAQNQVSLFAGEGTNALAMIGNGDKLGIVQGPVGGDISIQAGNVLRTQVYTGGTLWIGNASPGGETGNVTLNVGTVLDASCCGFEGQGSIIPMLAADLAGGNVTWQSTAADISIDQPMLYASSHDLTLMSVGNINIGGSIQNAQSDGGGAINLVAGWDGTTAMADVAATPGAYGNTDTAVSIGAGESGPDVAVGSASGATNVFANSLYVTADSGYAQLGYHGVGGGDINVQTTGNLTIESFGNADAMLGNGRFQEGDEGGVTGNIDVRVGGVFRIYDENDGDLGEHVWFGNVSAAFTETGNVTLLAADGDVPSSFSDMIAADLNGGDFTVGFTGDDGGSIGDLIYDSPHDFTALSTTDLYIGGSIQNDGSGAINLVAGWDGVSTKFADIRDNQGYGAEGFGTVTIDGYYGGAYVGSKGGSTNVLAGGLVVQTGFDEGTNAQLGYHGNGTGDINVLVTGQVALLGGDATTGSPYAMIGNGALDGSVTGDVGGNIYVSAQGGLVSETLDGSPPCDECGFTGGGGDAQLPPGHGGPLHDPGLPFVTGIGNATGDGTLSGNTTLLAGSFDDEFDTNGGFSRMVVGDLAYGDVTLGHIGCGCGLDIVNDIIYDSSHTLNLVSIGDVNIEAKVQNSGTGTINVVAGWDGDLAMIGVAGHYGVDDQGTVNIGGSDAAGDSWIGGAQGATNVYAANLSLSADNGYAQLGYHGAGGGDINVTVTQNINAFGNNEIDNGMQVGNGSLMGDVEGDITGNISLKAGNQTVFFSQQGASWLGNFASDGFKETGNVTSVSATGSFAADFMQADLGTSADTGGDLFIGFNGPSDAQGFHISGLEFNSPHALVFATTASLDVTGNVINDGTGAITLVSGWDGMTVGSGQDILAANAYGLNGTHMNVGGDHHYVIGDDEFEFDNNQTANLSVGSAGGRTMILAGDITVAPSEGFYAQIGYHGLGGGDIQVVSTGDITLTGGASSSEYAMIGNGSLTGDVEGQATGNVGIFATGTVALNSGADEGENVWLGNASGLTPSGNLTIVANDLTSTGDNTIGDMIGIDLNGGDVLIGLTDPENGRFIDENVSADSSHTLSLLAMGDLTVEASIQNSGTGGINLVAGWDGTTFDPAHFFDEDVSGNGRHGVTIGGSGALGDISVGSADGATHVAGSFVTVDGEGHGARLGYGGEGGTGILTIHTPGELSLIAGEGASSQALLGNQTGGVVVYAAAITQQAGTAVTATNANFNAASGDISLASSQNNITGTLRAVADDGNVSVTSRSGMMLDLIEAGDGATIKSGGAITQMAERNIDVTGALDVESTGGDITLDARDNSFGDVTVSTTGTHNATIVKGGALNVASASVGGTLILRATTGDITQSGTIAADGLGVTAESGAITLTNTGNSFNSLAFSSAAGSDASFTSSGDLEIAGGSAGGTLTLTVSNGAITQDSGILAKALHVSTTGGTITLNDIGNDFASLTVGTTGSDNASIRDDRDFSVGTSSVGGALTLIAGEGSITQTGAITAAALNVTSTEGSITLTNAGNSFASLTASSRTDADIHDSTGVAIGASTVGGLFTIAAGGAISQTAAITVAGLDVSTSAGAIVLTNADNDIHQVTVHTAGDASITNSDALLVTGASVGGTLTLNADGQISQTGGIAAGTLDITVTSGSIGLFASDNNFANLRVTNLNGGAGITDNGNVNVTGANVGGQLALTVNAGGITQSGAIHAATLRLNATADITLDNAANSFATLYLNANGAADLVDSTGVAIGTSHVGGKLTLHAGGAVTQVLPANNAPQQLVSALSAGGLDISTSAGGITLTQATNHVTGTAAFNAPGDISYTNDGAIDVGQTQTDGKLTVRAGGAITQSGYIHAAGLDAGTSAGGITLLNKGNAVVNGTNAAVFFSAPGDVAFVDSDDIVIGATNLTGALSLSTLGSIGQAGTLNSGALTLIAGHGIVLNDSGNSFGPVSITVSGGGNASLTSSGAIVVSDATLTAGEGTPGGLTLTAHGAISQTGAIVAGRLTAATDNGDIVLGNQQNAVASTVLLSASGAATFVNSVSTDIGASTAGGRLNLVSAGAVTQSGALHSTGLSVTANGGAITLTNTGNAIGGSIGLSASGAATLYNTLASTLSGVTAGGDITLLSKGNVAFLGSAQTVNGNVTVVAGWDGTTTTASSFGNTGVYGNTNGSVVVGGNTAQGGISVGSQHGATAIYGYGVTVNGSTAGYGQIGYHGAGGGSITIRALSDLTLNGLPASGYAMIGNGSFGSDVSGAVTGDIDIRAGGSAVFNSVGTSTEAWIGNKTASGGETGNLTLVATDSTGTQDCDIGCFAQADIVGGDVTLAVTGTGDHEIDGVMTYNSSHNLTLLLAGNLAITGTLQNAGSGAVTLVAGWDGHTMSGFGTAGVFGNGGKGVLIGGADAEGNSAFGSAGGTTSIYGASLTLSAQHGYAQLGYNGHGTGAIVVDVTGAVTLTGGAGANQFAQIGNGGQGTSGNNSGDITITAGGDLTLTGGAGQEAYAQIGHGGAETDANSTGYSNTGAINATAANVVLASGTGAAAYTQIGHGGYKAGAGLLGQATNSGAITITSGHTVSLTGNGADAYAQIGNGGNQSNLNPSAQATGTDGGNIIVHAPNGANGSVTLNAGAGANAYAQIGNGGYAINAGANAVADHFTVTGDITVTDLAITGNGPNGYAVIGNGDAALASYGNISGNILIDANGQISYQNGTSPHSPGTIGNFTGHGTVTGTINGATPPNDGPGEGPSPTDPVIIGVVVTNNGNNNDNKGSAPPITIVNVVVITDEGGDNGPTVVASLEPAAPGPLALLDPNGADGSTPYSADSATVVIADSLDGGKKPGSTLTLMPGMLKQTGGLGGSPHGVPPADQDFSSWGNEALWQ